MAAIFKMVEKLVFRSVSFEHFQDLYFDLTYFKEGTLFYHIQDGIRRTNDLSGK
jgi:hypothetical protein